MSFTTQESVSTVRHNPRPVESDSEESPVRRAVPSYVGGLWGNTPVTQHATPTAPTSIAASHTTILGRPTEGPGPGQGNGGGGGGEGGDGGSGPNPSEPRRDPPPHLPPRGGGPPGPPDSPGGMDLTEVEVTLQTKDPPSLKEREKSRNQLFSTETEPRQKSSLTNSSYSLREDHTISLPTIPKFLQHFSIWKEEL